MILFAFFHKIIWFGSSLIHKKSGQLQIGLFSCFQVKLHKRKFHFLMSRIPQTFSLSEIRYNIVCRPDSYIQKLFLSGCLFVCNRGLKHMSHAIELMIIPQIRPAMLYSFFYLIICINIAILQLRIRDQVDDPVHLLLQLRIRRMGKAVRTCLNPFIKIAVLKNHSKIFTVFPACCDFKILNYMAWFHITYLII